jgi:hypothetical protein
LQRLESMMQAPEVAAAPFFFHDHNRADAQGRVLAGDSRGPRKPKQRSHNMKASRSIGRKANTHRRVRESN